MPFKLSKIRTAKAGLLLALLLAASSVLASVPSSSGGAAFQSSSVQTYSADFFLAFQPVNAVDILNRVPGAKAVLAKADAGGRGFNENSQLILINGKPISAKTNSVSSMLSRISADSVVRVDVIRGGVPGLNISSSETIIDLRLAARDSSSVAWDAKLLGYEERERAGKSGVFVTRQQADSSFIGGVELELRGRPEFHTNSIADGNGQLTQVRAKSQLEDGAIGRLSSTYSRSIDSGSTLQLNALFEDFDKQLSKERSQRQPVNGELVLEEIRLIEEQDVGYKWELGVDFEQPLSAQNASEAGEDIIKWQWIQNRSNSEFDNEVKDLLLLDGLGLDGLGLDLSIESKSRVSGETIAKATLFSNYREGFSGRSGVELVYNSLEQQLLLTENGDISEDSDQRIAEERAELSWFGKLQLQPSLEVEAGAKVEYSAVRQSGDLRRRREFVYPKPSVEWSWRPSSEDNWLLALQRTVAQLNLEDFTNSVNFEDDAVRPANPNLEPQKAWELRWQYEKVLVGGGGNVSVEYFYNRLEDVVDQLPVSSSESVLGNIGDGHLQGFKLTTDLALTANTRANIDYQEQRSEVTDPFTNETRALRDVRERVLTLELRREFPVLPLSAGVIYYYKGPYENRRIDQVNRVSETEGYLDTYLEWQLPNKLSMRFDLKNIFDNTVETEKVNYALSIDDGMIDSVEQQDRRIGVFWELTISGQI